MKKFYYIVGALVTATAIFTLVAVMLKKLRISLCIEGVDDDLLVEDFDGDVTLSFGDTDEDELECDPEIETIITEEDSDQL